MIDRYGKRISVAWSAHEILWVQAAMTLPTASRCRAYQDISDMTGRAYAQVQWKATFIRNAQRSEEGRQKALLRQRRPEQAPKEPSFVRPPSIERLRAGRA